MDKSLEIVLLNPMDQSKERQIEKLVETSL